MSNLTLSVTIRNYGREKDTDDIVAALLSRPRPVLVAPFP